MQDCAIVLGGFESGYMKKMALYLKTRLDSRMQVQIVRNQIPQPDGRDAEHTVWIGSKSFIETVEKRGAYRNLIVLDDEETGDETHIFRFQSCEKLYRRIWERCGHFGLYPVWGIREKRQNWIVMTGDCAGGTLTAFSMVCAQILGENEHVLYINLSECSGMRQLFDLDMEERELSDLFLELRKGKEINLETFAGRLEQADYLLPPENPMILHEIDDKDMQKFLEVIRRADRYDRVIFALGNTVCGCDRILVSASRIIHLTAPGLVNSCVRKAWLHFFDLCFTERDQSDIEQISAPEMDNAENCGTHLIDDWMEGEAGALARACLGERKETEDDSAVAGDTGSSVW